MTIEATAAHVETTTALPSLRPLVCHSTDTCDPTPSIHKRASIRMFTYYELSNQQDEGRGKRKK